MKRLIGKTGLALALALGLMVASLLSPKPLPATGAPSAITVDTTADEFNDGDHCSLREAIQAANIDAAVDACPPGSGDDTILLGTGTYTLTRVGVDDVNVAGDLDITDTHALLMTIGRITPQGVEIDEEARSTLRQKVVERLASCRDCFCYWTCAGGCLPRALSPGPDGHLNHGAHCELKRVLLKEMLLKEIAAGNGLRKRTPHRCAAGEH